MQVARGVECRDEITFVAAMQNWCNAPWGAQTQPRVSNWPICRKIE
jgi:hypothetical protein